MSEREAVRGEGSRVRGECEKWSFVERRAEKREKQEVTGRVKVQ